MTIARQCATRGTAAIGIVASLLALAGAAEAADSRFERVVLLVVPDRVSLVIELSAAPAHVDTRRISGGVLELDAGPVTPPVRSEWLAAPPGTRFIADVSIQPGASTVDGPSVRARITLLELSRSSVRVVGRRVYIDFSRDEGFRVEAPPPRRAQPAARPVSVAAAPVGQPGDRYETAVRPAIARFEQLAPFLMSATGDPSAPVLKAVSDTLSTVNESVKSVDVPSASRHAHDALTSAIALAAAAVDPSFGGDRVARAREALAQLQRAKAELEVGS